ncbi:MAG TPA: hypothetical protein DCZ80_06580 [Legionellales bacterium]|nr:hypothetical protein [Legionellales bacterium]
MANIDFHFFPAEALEKNEKISDKREIFIDQQKIVDLRFEFEEERAYQLFNELPENLLPQLPKGYQWVRSHGKYGMMRHQDSVEHQMEVLIYGPDAKGLINFICRRDHVSFFSFAHTQDIGAPVQRRYPLTSKAYKVTGFDYTHTKFKHHIRGHMIDHHDSILRIWNSSSDIRNYTPEAPIYEWGMGIRRLITADLRALAHGGVYAQYNSYELNPLKTANGTPVPEHIRLFTYQCNVQINTAGNTTNNYHSLDLFHISYSEPLEKPARGKVLEHARDNYCSDWESAPIIFAYEQESSDRALRLRGRHIQKQAFRVSNGNAASRFVDQDFYDLSCIAGDYEFEQCSRRLSAGILSHEQNCQVHTVNYCASSLNYAEKLLELDLQNPTEILEVQVRREAHAFFKSANDNDVMLGLSDRFEKLCADLGPD